MILINKHKSKQAMFDKAVITKVKSNLGGAGESHQNEYPDSKCPYDWEEVIKVNVLSS